MATPVAGKNPRIDSSDVPRKPRPDGKVITVTFVILRRVIASYLLLWRLILANERPVLGEEFDVTRGDELLKRPTLRGSVTSFKPGAEFPKSKSSSDSKSEALGETRGRGGTSERHA